MKKLLMIGLIILIGNSVFGQDTEPNQTLAKQDYLQKSKNQQTAAWILLGAGAAATVGGIIWFGNEFDLFGNDESVVPAVVTGVGILSMAGSIPLFVASSRNRKKAMAINTGLQINRAWAFRQNGMGYNNYPALSVRLQFK